MERRYTALGFIAGLYQLIGALIVIGGIAFGGISLLNPRLGYGSTGLVFFSSVTGIVAAVISGVALYAFGELINLFRDMEFNSRVTAHYTELNEKNTRRTAEAIEHLARRRAQTSGGGTLPPQN